LNNYVICTVARSGKSWIAETLYWLGLGYGEEVLTHFARNCAPGQDRLRAAFDGEGMAGFARAFAKVRIEAGEPCVGVTLQWTNLEIIAAEKQPSELAAFIEALSPCVVFFLRRRDVLSQAISHYLMMESGYYHSTSPESRRPQRASVRYNRCEIDKYLEFTQRSYAGWSDLFAAADVVPEVLDYENFVDDPKRAFISLAERIAGRSFEPEAIIAAAACQSKISDETDSAFRARYLEADAGNHEGIHEG
jgi:LPS sulfotransferase NodH